MVTRVFKVMESTQDCLEAIKETGKQNLEYRSFLNGMTRD